MEYDIFDFMHLKREEIGFVVDRPKGVDEFVFIHFINPVEIRVHDQMITTMPHACILYAPNTPCYYAAKTFELYHDWIHFLPRSSEYNPLYLGVPLNKIFYTSVGNKITKSMEYIQWYKNQDEKKVMSSELLKVFNVLSNENALHKKSNDERDKELFQSLRMLIYQTPKNWNTTSMSEYVHLSRSWFSVKYKAIIGVSPLEDLCNAKNNMAKSLLLTTPMTVENIAFECGYKSVAFFVQKFKKETGYTPAVWRSRYKTNEE